MPRRKQPAIPDELLDQLLGGSNPRAALADGVCWMGSRRRRLRRRVGLRTGGVVNVDGPTPPVSRSVGRLCSCRQSVGASI
jgi:hypothetical protein